MKRPASPEISNHFSTPLTDRLEPPEKPLPKGIPKVWRGILLSAHIGSSEKCSGIHKFFSAGLWHWGCQLSEQTILANGRLFGVKRSSLAPNVEKFAANLQEVGPKIEAFFAKIQEFGSKVEEFSAKVEEFGANLHEFASNVQTFAAKE